MSTVDLVRVLDAEAARDAQWMIQLVMTSSVGETGLEVCVAGGTPCRGKAGVTEGVPVEVLAVHLSW